MMIVDEGGHGADLDSVGVVGRVLEQAVVGVKELARHQEKELSGRAAVIQPVNTTTHLAHYAERSLDGTGERYEKNIMS